MELIEKFPNPEKAEEGILQMLAKKIRSWGLAIESISTRTLGRM